MTIQRILSLIFIISLFFACSNQVEIMSSNSMQKAIGQIGSSKSNPPITSEAINLPENKLTPPLVADLSLEEPIRLGQASVLRLIAESFVDAPNTTINFFIPEGIELVRGDTSWAGSLISNIPKTIEIVIKPIRQGSWQVKAEVIVTDEGGGYFGIPSSLYLEVGSDHVTISKIPVVEAYVNEYTSIQIDQKVVAPAFTDLPPKTKHNLSRVRPLENTPLGSINVYGYWFYQYKDESNRPLRDARVEIWDSCNSGACDQKLATTYTDSNGFYYAGGLSNTDENVRRDIYIKAFTTDDYSVKVTNLSTSDPYYSRSAVLTDVPDGNVYMGSYSSPKESHGSAFYIYDMIANDAYYYLYNQVGWDNDNTLQVRWSNSSSHGTHYHLDGSIDLVAGDGWDEDVFLHEYGHFVMYKTYGTYPPTPSCNPHGWGYPSSTGCAWSEGWATFLQGAIQGSPNYIDTDDMNIYFTLEPPSPWATHPNDEGAVGAGLWDIFDSAIENHDSLNNGFNGVSSNGIWKIFYNYDPNTIQDFWNYWGSAGNGYYLQVWSILNYLSINYDTTPPGNPQSVSSGSHALSTWSNDPTVDINWSGASDGSGSGINGYSVVWSTSSSTIPDTAVDTTGSSQTSPALSTGSSWYVHIRTKDNAVNWNSAATHYGPFYIDTTIPSNPTSASPGCIATNDVWQNTCSDPNFIWSGTSDTGSGVAGYNYYWGTDPNGTSSNYTSSGLYDPTAVPNPSIYYLRVRTRDNAGNNASGWITLFTLKYDIEPPSSNMIALPADQNAVYINVSWTGDDVAGGSGILGYDIQYRLGTSGTWENWSIGTSSTNAQFGPNDPVLLENGQTYYFRIRATDGAGNIESYPGGDGDTSTTIHFQSYYLVMQMR